MYGPTYSLMKPGIKTYVTSEFLPQEARQSPCSQKNDPVKRLKPLFTTPCMLAFCPFIIERFCENLRPWGLLVITSEVVVISARIDYFLTIRSSESQPERVSNT